MAERLVLVRLGDHANDQGLCWPGKDTLAEACCMSKRTVDSAIATLESRKLISIVRRTTEGGKNRSNLYQLHLDQGDLFKGADSAVVQNLQDCKSRQLGVQNLQGEGAKSAPEPTIEPITEPKEHSSSGDEVRKPPEIYESKKGKRLTGVVLELFDRFWDAFDYKSGKAAAADAWLRTVQPRLKSGTLNLEHLLAAARHEASERPRLKESGGIPKMAEGWITDRRWEDFTSSGAGKPDIKDLPWYCTWAGIQEEGASRGVTYFNFPIPADFTNELIKLMREAGEPVPPELIKYQQQMQERAA
jgi:hypothetical protein